MKKSILIIILVMASAVIALNLKVLSSSSSLSLALAEVEALANGEGGGPGEDLSGGENDNNGNKYYYDNLQSRPKQCSLYRYYDNNGNPVYTTERPAEGIDYEIIATSLMDSCPTKGNGCTPYNCVQL